MPCELKAGVFWTIVCALPLAVIGNTWLHSVWQAGNPKFDVAGYIFTGLFAFAIAAIVVHVLFFRKDVFAYYRFDRLIFRDPDYNRLFQEMNPPFAPDANTPWWSKDLR